MSPKSRSKRNGGECAGERMDIVAPGGVSDQPSTLDGTVNCKGNSTTHNIRQDLYVEEQPQQEGQEQDLRKKYKSDASESLVINNHNNNSSVEVDEINEIYGRSSQKFSGNAPSTLDIGGNFRNPISPTPRVNSERFFHSPSNIRGTTQETLHENIAAQNEPNELDSERSSVGPLIIAEENCSSTTPNTLFSPEDRAVRQESTLESQIPEQLIGNLNRKSDIIPERLSVPYERKRTFDDINMDRYTSRSVPVTNSHVPFRQRSPPPPLPHHTQNRSQHPSRGSSSHSLHIMPQPVDLPPPQISPPNQMHLPPPPPLSHRSSISTVITPGNYGQKDRGRSHSRPNSWSHSGNPRLEFSYASIF